ncbi:peptidoglycan-binding domain-containing protein [Streptantibioticus cattleyicolor]|uniref:Putative glycosyl transferase n=1 Tax=Streptantibioticus cattleyicolor (strain ATCC 35852 / DSM 46488 / JCM 4925 / NBRC 14057 / NRRL 8057) TaxID=1003195 RepID=F8JLZ5_STREN|nr:peptidoglycan-binding domain-containing protein [Streptantibioticus cattleyicolor]AEW99872.1 putative glycosyl transferase [Streptantibioticus cattleyicolor NRRL 8057 = DSM 46488]CCB71093.1 conserved exported protein of unknown function [Streptantibioticus cattleyicolor NRRL 8057 = DSM 46488]
MNIRRSLTAAAAACLTAGAVFAAVPTQAVAAPVQPAYFTCNYTASEPELSVGDTGTAVKQAQCQLNSVLDRHVVSDGIFGSGTRNAVIAFQECAGLGTDGIIGPNTWSALDYWWLNDIDCHK